MDGANYFDEPKTPQFSSDDEDNFSLLAPRREFNDMLLIQQEYADWKEKNEELLAQIESDTLWLTEPIHSWQPRTAEESWELQHSRFTFIDALQRTLIPGRPLTDQLVWDNIAPVNENEGASWHLGKIKYSIRHLQRRWKSSIPAFRGIQWLDSIKLKLNACVSLYDRNRDFTSSMWDRNCIDGTAQHEDFWDCKVHKNNAFHLDSCLGATGCNYRKVVEINQDCSLLNTEICLDAVDNPFTTEIYWSHVSQIKRESLVPYNKESYDIIRTFYDGIGEEMTQTELHEHSANWFRGEGYRTLLANAATVEQEKTVKRRLASTFQARKDPGARFDTIGLFQCPNHFLTKAGVISSCDLVISPRRLDKSDFEVKWCDVLDWSPCSTAANLAKSDVITYLHRLEKRLDAFLSEDILPYNPLDWNFRLLIEPFIYKELLLANEDYPLKCCMKDYFPDNFHTRLWLSTYNQWDGCSLKTCECCGHETPAHNTRIMMQCSCHYIVQSDVLCCTLLEDHYCAYEWNPKIPCTDAWPECGHDYCQGMSKTQIGVMVFNGSHIRVCFPCILEEWAFCFNKYNGSRPMEQFFGFWHRKNDFINRGTKRANNC